MSRKCLINKSTYYITLRFSQDLDLLECPRTLLISPRIRTWADFRLEEKRDDRSYINTKHWMLKLYCTELNIFPTFNFLMLRIWNIFQTGFQTTFHSFHKNCFHFPFLIQKFKLENLATFIHRRVFTLHSCSCLRARPPWVWSASLSRPGACPRCARGWRRPGHQWLMRALLLTCGHLLTSTYLQSWEMARARASK